jgi:C4-dicarboxylate-specific signal transduction histidine kinase
MSASQQWDSLMASIANEANHPLASARNNAGAALHFLDQKPPDIEAVREALCCLTNDIDRAADVISHSRALVRKAPSRAESFDTNAAIRDVIVVTRSEAAKNGISVEARLPDGLPLIKGDRVQLQQVILNLIVNAIQAMSETSAGPRQLLISAGKADSNGVLVAVRDSGPGLGGTLDHVFEAFHTTKPDGLGLGLSICRSIIEAHGGRLWATSCEPQGALFQFTIPAN